MKLTLNDILAKVFDGDLKQQFKDAMAQLPRARLIAYANQLDHQDPQISNPKKIYESILQDAQVSQKVSSMITN